MAEPTFSVPIVQQDLRQEEAIVQIVDSLAYLQKCAECVFTKIEARLEAGEKKLSAVHARIGRCRQQVDKLSSTKRAAKVLSSAKYPASDVFHPYNCIFPHEDKLPFQRSDVEIKSKITVPYRTLQEKMQFYHVKNNSKMLRKNLDIASEEGLGKLPKNITSVASLLLFNTTENPYKSNLADRFGLHYRVKQAVVEPEELKPKQTPTPTRSANIEPENKVGYYSPSMVQVPELDIPMDLPNLPGIADGLDFLMDPPLSIISTPPPPPSQAEPTPARVPAPQVTPPAPPPPAPVPSAAPAAPAPPPPPPPPAVVPIFVEATSTTSENKTPPKSQGGSDMRANLMAAIRQAGQMNLRSVSEKKMESKKKKQEEKEKVVSGDLMADLHAKLKLRRTGISGANKPEGIMEKIAAMIPAPPVGAASGQQHCDSEEGSDWDP